MRCERCFKVSNIGPLLNIKDVQNQFLVYRLIDCVKSQLALADLINPKTHCPHYDGKIITYLPLELK